MLDRINDGEWGDWQYVFEYAKEPAPARDDVDKTGFTREDVTEILHIEDGENDGTDWIGVFKLKDGRYAALRAWCDYTGWG